MIASEIRQWVSDLKLMLGDSVLYANRTAVACYCYNWATDPSALRTDREHAACKKLARYAKTYLVPGWWVESESGRLLPCPSYNQWAYNLEYGNNS